MGVVVIFLWTPYCWAKSNKRFVYHSWFVPVCVCMFIWCMCESVSVCVFVCVYVFVCMFVSVSDCLSVGVCLWVCDCGPLSIMWVYVSVGQRATYHNGTQIVLRLKFHFYRLIRAHSVTFWPTIQLELLSNSCRIISHDLTWSTCTKTEA